MCYIFSKNSFFTILIIFASTLLHNCIADVDLHAPLFNKQNPFERLTFNDLGYNKKAPPEEKFTSFWYDLAQKELDNRIKNRVSAFKKAKNIILFLGDGMPISTITATRIYKGQKLFNKTGEETELYFDQFPYTGFSKTYCTNGQVADSACSATAFLSGVKANLLTVGVNANVDFNNCNASMTEANRVYSLASWAQAAGKHTGLITTTTVTHASPSAIYAHAANRLWECDTDIYKYGVPGTSTNTCDDIAKQLITSETGKKLKVVLGGGAGKFLPKFERDRFGKLGERWDYKNLLKTWQGDHDDGVIVHNRQDLLNINVNDVTAIFGLFASGNMNFNSFADKTIEPTLTEMTEKAIDFLSKDDKGFFLMVEGGHIDTANHRNLAEVACEETLEFEKAIKLAHRMTNPEETLIVVTTDHGHPMSINGFPGRGNPIFGLNKGNKNDYGIEYMTISYAAGSQQYLYGNRQYKLDKLIGTKNFIFPSHIPIFSGVHSGEDVPIYATGPQASLFSGTLQQSTIPHMMAYVACIGKYANLPECLTKS